MADVIIPDIVKIYEGGIEIYSTSYNVGETYQFRVQLVSLTGTSLDTTNYTLTHGIYNSAGSLESTAGTITKDINELGVIEFSGIDWGSSGVKNLYITATNGSVIKKFGPYKVNMRAL